MHRATLVLALLFLAACTDVTPTPRPLALYIAQATQDVAAEQTQRADRVTATANAVAFRALGTQIAGEAALSVTRSAASVQQTWQSITATAQSLQGTQIALGRLGAQATQTQALWPTAAKATSDALYAAADARSNQVATSAVWSWAFVVFVAIVLGVVALVAVIFGASLILARTDVVYHNWRMNRLEEEERYAEVCSKYPEAPEPPDDTQAAILRDRWLTVWDIFLRSGDAVGFTSRALVPDCISSPRDWQNLTDYLAANGMLTKSGNSDTSWAPGVDAQTAMDRLKALPCPTFRLPDVKLLGNAPRLKRMVTPETTAVGGC